MSGPGEHRDRPGPPLEPSVQPESSGRAISSILGVFAGTGRGTRIGATVGTCGCFLVMMASAIFDSVTRGDDVMPLGATLIAWVFVAVWFLVVSLMLGGVGGAFLGAMVGAFFPMRRGPR